MFYQEPTPTKVVVTVAFSISTILILASVDSWWNIFEIMYSYKILSFCFTNPNSLVSSTSLHCETKTKSFCFTIISKISFIKSQHLSVHVLVVTVPFWIQTNSDECWPWWKNFEKMWSNRNFWLLFHNSQFIGFFLVSLLWNKNQTFLFLDIISKICFIKSQHFPELVETVQISIPTNSSSWWNTFKIMYDNKTLDFVSQFSIHNCNSLLWSRNREFLLLL